jgi:hypothetical protein
VDPGDAGPPVALDEQRRRGFRAEAVTKEEETRWEKNMSWVCVRHRKEIKQNSRVHHSGLGTEQKKNGSNIDIVDSTWGFFLLPRIFHRCGFVLQSHSSAPPVDMSFRGFRRAAFCLFVRRLHTPYIERRARNRGTETPTTTEKETKSS